MEPLELTMIIQLIDTYRTEYDGIWKSLSTILHNQDEAVLHQYVNTFFQQQGLTTHLLSSNPIGLYAETSIELDRVPTLLCCLDYNPQAPVLPQAQAIAASLLSIMTYQRLLAARIDLSPIRLKWFLAQKKFLYTEQLQRSIKQQPEIFRADACLWYEPLTTTSTIVGHPNNLILATGTKGYLSIELQVQTAPTVLHSHYGAIAPNAAWRLIWALNSLKDQREEILIEGFYDTVVSLEDNAFQQLANLPDTAALQSSQWGTSEMLMGLHGKQMHYAHILTPTCTINMLNSEGEKPELASLIDLYHSIPATARAIVDFYLVPGQNPEDIFDKLKSHLHHHGFSDIQVTLRYAGSPAYTLASSRFIQLVAQTTEDVYRQAPIILPVLPEHVPIQSLTQNSSQPAIILPLYLPVEQKRQEDEQQVLWNSTIHLTYIMLRLFQHPI
jgi:Peptidase dimerisation domain